MLIVTSLLCSSAWRPVIKSPPGASWRVRKWRWRSALVDDRLNAFEAACTHNLLVVQRAVGPAELRVALVGQIAQAMVEGHRWPPILIVNCILYILDQTMYNLQCTMYN